MIFTIKDDFGRRKEVSRENYVKIISMESSIQLFFMSCNDLDLDKLYDVQDFEVQLKGIDILVMMHKLKESESKEQYIFSGIGNNPEIY